MVRQMPRFFIENERQTLLWERAAKLAARFAQRAARHDEDASFPFENFAELKEAGFLVLTVPRAYGGEEISLYEMLLVLESLASGDASTALGLGWHLGILMNLRESRAWEEAVFRRVCEEVVANGAMINSVATEPATGSPSRGGRPQTRARKTDSGWVLNGRKTWGTLSPVLSYFLVTAHIEGTEEIGEFLVPRSAPGLAIEETWNSLGMRATGSHDVVLREVKLTDEALTERRLPSQPSGKSRDGGGWLLHIPACYLGVALAARDFAVRFAREYQPNSVSVPIAHLPHVQDKIGRMELRLYTARSVLYHTAKRWDENPQLRERMQAELAAAKHVATNAAIEIVDLAMRIVGGRSLLKEYPLERYYRDVRAGLHNPPMDDVTVRMWAEKAFHEIDGTKGWGEDE